MSKETHTAQAVPTGLFPYRQTESGRRRSQRRNSYKMNPDMIWTPALDAQLCDLMAEDAYSHREIALRMGVEYNQLNGRWRRIVQSMGWQAL